MNEEEDITAEHARELSNLKPLDSVEWRSILRSVRDAAERGERSVKVRWVDNSPSHEGFRVICDALDRRGFTSVGGWNRALLRYELEVSW